MKKNYLKNTISLLYTTCLFSYALVGCSIDTPKGVKNDHQFLDIKSRTSDAEDEKWLVYKTDNKLNVCEYPNIMENDRTSYQDRTFSETLPPKAEITFNSKIQSFSCSSGEQVRLAVLTEGSNPNKGFDLNVLTYNFETEEFVPQIKNNEILKHQILYYKSKALNPLNIKTTITNVVSADWCGEILLLLRKHKFTKSISLLSLNQGKMRDFNKEIPGLSNREISKVYVTPRTSYDFSTNESYRYDPIVSNWYRSYESSFLSPELTIEVMSVIRKFIGEDLNFCCLTSDHNTKKQITDYTTNKVRIITCSGDLSRKVYISQKIFDEIHGPSETLHDLCFSPGCNKMAAVIKNKDSVFLNFFDLLSEKKTASLKFGDKILLKYLRFNYSPDGRIMSTTSNRQIAFLNTDFKNQRDITFLASIIYKGPYDFYDDDDAEYSSNDKFIHLIGDNGEPFYYTTQFMSNNKYLCVYQDSNHINKEMFLYDLNKNNITFFKDNIRPNNSNF